MAEKAGCSAATVTAACQGKKITLARAEAIARALDIKVDKLFTAESGSRTLSGKTILEYHRLIRTILAQADKEMLVPYNAAEKAEKPKANTSKPNYFQPEQISDILDALEKEPLKWKLITHLLIVTGARRGEIMGLEPKYSRLRFPTLQTENSHTLLDFFQSSG